MILDESFRDELILGTLFLSGCLNSPDCSVNRLSHGLWEDSVWKTEANNYVYFYDDDGDDDYDENFKKSAVLIILTAFG